MAVTSLTVLAPHDGQDFSATLRPHTNVKWAGGTGPFDVLYEWDTVTTFDSGNLISDLNKGVTSPDEGVPPSDMGPFGTDWYLRVTIYDLADTGTDEIQSVDNDATGGTFTLSFDGAGPTGDLDYNAPNVSVAAQGTLTLDTQPSDGDTLTVDTKTYTFQTTLTNVDGNIAIGADLAGSQSNLVEAFDLSGTAGTDYATAMTAHPTVDIAAFATNAAVLTAKTAGKGGNSIATTETFTAGTNVFDAATLGTTTLGNNGIVTELEALSTITSVTVSGSGTSGDPWLVTFTDPGDRDVPIMTADDTNLTGHTVGTTISESTKGVYPTGTVAPGTGYHTVQFVDPADFSRFLYVDHNIGVNFGDGGAGSDHPDGDPAEFPRFLYLNSNIGVGFGIDVSDGLALGDGDPRLIDRFLYLNHNITGDQPCPYIHTVAPVLVSQGDPITIVGDSFGATPATWGGEVRLYDAQGYGGSYTVLSTTTWSDTNIVATIPSGAASGWIGVVHTTGTPSCTGSTQKSITVLQVEADPETGWYVVAADHKNVNVEAIDTTITRAKIKPVMNAIGTGRIDVPLGDQDGIDRLIDPTSRTATLLKVYTDRRFRYGFYAEKLRHEYEEEGEGGIAIIEGRGMEVVTKHMLVLAHDAPANPSLAPLWIYGSNENYVENPGFDDAADNPILNNPGGEDGNDDDGRLIGWSEKGSLSSMKSIEGTASYEGAYYIEFDPTTWHSGITQTVTVEPGRVYHVHARVKEPTAAGLRVTMQLGGADDMAATGTYTENYEYQNDIYAELDNTARDPNENGCPGGATDGTWQTLDVEVTTGEDQKSLSIAIQDDHHDNNCVAVGHPPVYVDAVSIEGWGLGLEPWNAYAPTLHASSSFRLQTVKTLDSSPYGLYLNLTARYGGVEQWVDVTPNTKYTATIWAWTDLLNADDSYKWEIHPDPDVASPWLGFVETIPTDETWTPYTVVFETGEDDTRVLLRFVYSGPNNPGPIYIDSASLVPGEPASTPGKILIDLLAPIQARGAGDFVVVSFDEDYDSKGRPWNANLALDVSPGEDIYGVLSRLVALGYEWDLVPTNFSEGGDTGFELNVYNARAFDPDSGIGTSWLDDAEGPVISPGNATIGGRIVKQVFNVNVVHAIGDDGSWSEAQQEPFAGVGGYEDSYGRIEDVIQAGSTSDATMLSKFAEARIEEEADREVQLQVKMQRSASLRPFLHFGVGDSLYVDLPPYLPDETHSDPKRIRAISADLKDEGADVTFRVDVDRVIYEDEMAAYAAIAQLKERSPSENSGQGTGSVSATGTVSGSVSTTTTTTPHTHDLDADEIKKKATSGDVSGEIPGPLSVQAIRGIPWDPTIPDETSPDLNVIPVYDRALSSWIPSEASVQASGVAPPISYARIRRTSDYSIPSPSTYTTIPWQTETVDTDDYWEGVTNPTRLTAPRDGTYRISACVAFSAVTNSQMIAGYWINGADVNGSQLSFGRVNDSDGTSIQHFNGSDIVELTTDDYVEIVCWTWSSTRKIQALSSFAIMEFLGS